MLNGETQPVKINGDSSSGSYTPGRWDQVNAQLAALEKQTLVAALELLWLGDGAPLARIGFGIVQPGAQLHSTEKNRSKGRLILPYEAHLLWKNAFKDPRLVALERRQLRTLQSSGARLLSQTPTGGQYFQKRLVDASFNVKKFSVVIGDDKSKEFLQMLAESFNMTLPQYEQF